MTTIQIRIDEKTKKDANKVFNKIGIDMSTAIKIYLKKVINKNGIPFDLLSENGLTIKEEKEILKRADEIKKNKNISKTMTAEEAINYLDS